MENTELSVIVYVVPTLLMMLACLCWHFPIGILLGAHFRLTHLLATVCKVLPSSLLALFVLSCSSALICGHALSLQQQDVMHLASALGCSMTEGKLSVNLGSFWRHTGFKSDTQRM